MDAGKGSDRVALRLQALRRFSVLRRQPQKALGRRWISAFAAGGRSCRARARVLAAPAPTRSRAKASRSRSWLAPKPTLPIPRGQTGIKQAWNGCRVGAASTTPQDAT